MLCPACENESENTQQCTNCGWQFVYFTQEPTEKEQNEYTSLLQNYRTEFFFAKAIQYFENKQYEETIQCCLISCEHQLFENPLALLALSYKELGNNDEALKYVNMTLQINQNNELVKELMLDFEDHIHKEKSDDILKLTPDILEKDIFETTEEHENRIKNLGYVEIGTVLLRNYNADQSELRIISVVNDNIKAIYPKNKDFEDTVFYIKMNSSDAKYLYSLEVVKLIAKIQLDQETLSILDIKLDKYSFLNEFLNYKQFTKNEEITLKNELDKLPIVNMGWELYVYNYDVSYTYKEALSEINNLKESTKYGKNIRIPSKAIVDSFIQNEEKLNINTNIIFFEGIWTNDIKKKDPNDRYDDVNKRVWYGMNVFSTNSSKKYKDTVSHEREKAKLFFICRPQNNTVDVVQKKDNSSFFSKMWS